MPVRNDAAMLRNCLAGIDNQSLTDYELVVVDDGSTDQTPVLLEKASQDDSRIRMIRTEPQGIVSALNRSILRSCLISLKIIVTRYSRFSYQQIFLPANF